MQLYDNCKATTLGCGNGTRQGHLRAATYIRAPRPGASPRSLYFLVWCCQAGQWGIQRSVIQGSYILTPQQMYLCPSSKQGCYIGYRQWSIIRDEGKQTKSRQLRYSGYPSRQISKTMKMIVFRHYVYLYSPSMTTSAVEHRVIKSYCKHLSVKTSHLKQSKYRR